MLLNVQTSSSELIPISDFRYLYDLARCSKCQRFLLLKGTNKLYGTNDECCTIHEIDVPFLVNTDLEFRLDCMDKDSVMQYQSYFVPEKFNWVILPDYYWDMYIGGDITAKYSKDEDLFILIDKTTKQPIQQIHMYKCRLNNDFVRHEFIRQVEGFLIRTSTLGKPELFTKIEQHPAIRKAYDSKVSIGRFLARFTNSNIDVAFYFFKGLFSLSKADTCDLEIRFDRFETNLFLATFKPKKKKNPLVFNTYGIPFSEKIHCMFINIV